MSDSFSVISNTTAEDSESLTGGHCEGLY